MTNLEEAARRTCDFEETAMAEDEMIKDREIIAALNQLDKALKKHNRYFIFYTHKFVQGDAPNMLVTPKDKRFDRVELLGLIIDMLGDYFSGANWTLKGSKELDAAIKVLKDIHEGKIDAC